MKKSDNPTYALRVPKAPPRISLSHVCQKRPKEATLGYDRREQLREHVLRGHAPHTEFNFQKRRKCDIISV